MKTIRTLIMALCVLCALEGFGQSVAIPDSNFGNWLNANGYASCLSGNSTSGWHLDTTCTAVRTSQGINCPGANIHDLTGVQYFKSIRYLICDSNHLTFLPKLTDSLNRLQCRFNQIASLSSALPLSLQNLTCDYNSLATLPALPIGLYTLSCSNNHLTALPLLPDSLFYLYCTFNNITSISALPHLLVMFYCGNNQLSALPSLTDSITYFGCNNNNLTSLPALPRGLRALECSSNSITSLPALPDSLGLLSCTHNLLTSIPAPINHMGFLSCGYNRLTSIPALPNFLGSLYCDHNNLSSLPTLPDSLYQFSCNNNAAIRCLPHIYKSHLNLFYIDSTNIQCMPNHVTATLYDLRPDSLPVCGAGNANGCPAYYGVLIPDTNFGTWLNTHGYNTCMTGNSATGWYMDTTCSAVLNNSTMICRGSNISDLTGIQYFKSLNWLDCDSNNLSSLPILQASITYLDFGSNHFSTAPVLPANLLYLYCQAMNSATLPGVLPATLPNSLLFLDCVGNHLTSLPTFPGSLLYLACFKNQLTSLPALPNSLTQLVCSYNPLTSLPVLPDSLRELYTSFCHLTSVPYLPKTITKLLCDHNPSLSCLPQIWKNNLDVFWIDSTNIQCMPNHFTATQYDLRPDSLPICGVGNANGCQIYNYVLIPDTNFGVWLNANGYSSCMTGSSSTHWYLDTTCSAVLTDTIIGCAGANINDLTGIQYFKNLTILACFRNNLSSLPSPLPASLTSLSCSVNQMTSLPTLPAHLANLNCSVNRLTSLPALPSSLVGLACSYNQLTSLPVLPYALRNLYVSNNLTLGCLPVVHSGSLDGFYMDSTNIQCMPNHFTAVRYDIRPDSLPVCGAGNVNGCAVNNNCVLIPDTNFGIWLNTHNYSSCMSGNSATGWYLDTLCSAMQPDTIIHIDSANVYDMTGVYYLKNVQVLHCHNNLMVTMARLPDNLIYLECVANHITNIPTLPNTLIILSCSFNNLTSLPAMPPHLRTLSCGFNQLTSLTAMPGSLENLQCDSNRLTSLPALANTSLISLSCPLNNITALPALPATIWDIACMNNPSLSCLPYVPTGNLNWLGIAGTNIQCMPNHFTATNYDVRPDSLPICGVGNANGCAVYNISAGPDQTVCTHAIATMAGSGSAAWFPASSNPSVVSFANDTLPTTTISGFDSIGTYTLLFGDTTTGVFDIIHIFVTSCVWPGDADANHIVDNNDLLPIGLAYDSIGPVRTVQGIVWQGDVSTDWADTLPGYFPTVNFKYADCNGDGRVDANDTLAIVTNFGLTHTKTARALPRGVAAYRVSRFIIPKIRWWQVIPSSPHSHWVIHPFLYPIYTAWHLPFTMIRCL